MAMQYTHQVLKVAVAQICQSIGFQSIQPTALELMSDILHRYLQEITRLSHHYAELYNRSEPNLDDVALAFKDSNVNLSDLQEYIQFVDPIKCAVEVPKYPLSKESHLNFLKPGSREVLTRPLHINEHLPPIDPVQEDEATDGVKPVELNEFGGIGADEPYLGQDASIEIPFDNGTKPENTFKRPGEPPSFENASKIPRLLFDENRGTREIGNTSHANSGFVMTTLMTTSGFISPARQGKLPDAICPVVHEHKPQATSAQSSLLPISSMDGKFDKKIKKKLHDKEKKKDRDKSSKDLFKPDKASSSKKIEGIPKPDDKIDIDKSIDSKKIDMSSNISDLPKNVDQRSWQEGLAPKSSSELKILKKQQKLLQQMKQKSSKQNRLQDGVQQLGKKPKKNKLGMQDKKGYTKFQQLGPNPFNVKQTKEAMPSQQSNKHFPDFAPSTDYHNPEKAVGNEMDIKMEPLAHPSTANLAPFSHLMSENLAERKFSHSMDDFNVMSTAPVSTIIDGKISAAPEKAKLNIFKKIPSKMKEEPKTPLELNPHLPVAPPSVINRALPMSSSNVIVIDDDSSPEPSEAASLTPQPLYTKQEFGTGAAGDFKPQMDAKTKVGASIQSFCAEQDLPLNLTGSGNKPQFNPNFPGASGMQPSGLSPNIQPYFEDAPGKGKSGPKVLDSVAALKKAQRKQKKESKLAAATAAAQQHQQQMMQDYSKSFLPSLPLGALGMPTFPYQFLPSRPGLIPESPLIPQFDPMRPFGWPMPGFGFSPIPQANPIVNSPRSDAAIPPARGRGRPPLHQNHHLPMMAQNKAGPSTRPAGPSNADMRNVNNLLGIDSKCNIASMVPDGLKLNDISLTPSSGPMFQQQPPANLPYYPPVPKKAKIPKVPKPPKGDNIDRVPGKRGPKPKNKDPKLPPFMPNIGGPHSQMQQQQPIFQQPAMNLDSLIKPTPTVFPKLPSATVATPLSSNIGETSSSFSSTFKEHVPDVMQHQHNLFNPDAAQSTSSAISIEPINREPKQMQIHESAMDQVSIFKVDKKIYTIESDEGNPDDSHQNSGDNTSLAERNLLESLNPPTPHSIDDNSSDISTALVIEERSKKEKRSKDKEHKKERKDKDGKVKKKKEKKDKTKNKSEKKKEREAAGEGSSGGKEPKLSKKEKKEKRKEKERLIAANESSSIHMNSEDTSDDGSQASVPKLTLKLGQAPPSPRSDTSEKKMVEPHREKPAFSSPNDVNRATPEHEFQLARISALVTRPSKADELSPTQRPKTDQSGQSDSSDVTVASKKHDRSGRPSKEGRSGGKKLKHSSPSCSAGPTTAKDAEGNEIWICPACGRVDDGSPMIGCDACDAWYHWLCVGIRVPPEGSWYCRVCIAQKQESFQSGEKKKKRKKKDKKEHQ